MKKKRIIFQSVVLVGLLTSCGLVVSNNYTWKLKDLGENVSFHTELQQDYLYDNYENIGRYAYGNKEQSRPNPIVFEWSSTPVNDEASKIINYELQLSKDKSFSTYKSYITNNTSYEIYNLNIATDYYWRVNANLEDLSVSYSEETHFKTSELGPRNIFVEGVSNIRDIGGWMTSNTKRVKQGLIYRSGRLNKSSSSEVIVEVSDKGKEVLLNDLGIRSQIDLRRIDNNEVGSITSSPLGSSVAYYQYPMDWEVSNILLDNKESVKLIFTLLSNIDNYPLMLHCNIGTDRTGLFAFLINALMGVSEEDLYRDYLFSNFGNIGGSRSIYGIKNSYVATIYGYEGETLSEKTKNCLLDLGVLEEEINSLIEILSE